MSDTEDSPKQLPTTKPTLQENWLKYKAAARQKLDDLGFKAFEILFQKDERDCIEAYANGNKMSFRVAVRDCACRWARLTPKERAAVDAPKFSTEVPRKPVAPKPASAQTSLKVSDLRTQLDDLRKLYSLNVKLQKRRYYYDVKTFGENYTPIATRRPGISKRDYIDVLDEVEMKLKQGASEGILKQEYQNKLQGFLVMLEKANNELAQKIQTLKSTLPKTSPPTTGSSS